MARVLAVVPAIIGFGLVSTAVPALARDPNNGDVWIDTVGAPAGPGHEHDPHLPCADLNLWGAGLADATGAFTIDSWPPSGGHQQVYLSATSSATWRSSGGRSPQVIATISAQVLITNAVAAGGHATRQGFHFKLQLSQDPQKHKTFWLRCPAPGSFPSPGGTASGGTGSGGGAAPGGTTPPGGTSPGGGGGVAGGLPGTGGPSAAPPSGSPGQSPGMGTSLSSGGSSTISLGTGGPYVGPGTLAQTGSPAVSRADPYLPSLPIMVLGLLVSLRPRWWLRLVRRIRGYSGAAY